MSGFMDGENRRQAAMFPERIDDYFDKNTVARVIKVAITY